MAEHPDILRLIRNKLQSAEAELYCYMYDQLADMEQGIADHGTVDDLETFLSWDDDDG